MTGRQRMSVRTCAVSEPSAGKKKGLVQTRCVPLGSYHQSLVPANFFECVQ